MTAGHRIATSVLVAIGLAASSSTSAMALPVDTNGNGSEVPAGSPSMQTQATAPVTQPTVVRLSAPANGFDWFDAGIGAAGGVALTMVGVGGTLVATGRRGRRTQGTRAVAG
jgi:hypothetical protein